MSVESILIADEGLRLRVYLDTKGKMTIGCGRNLEDVGISEEEALFMLRNDILTARKECAKYPWFQELIQDRQDAIVCMMFNLGASKFSEFKRLIAALSIHDFDSAAQEMKSSRWAVEVGERANRLADMVKSGVMAP